MVMLEPRAGVWTIPLTERPHHLPDHPGQISLPGGRLESNETHEIAAKREFCEELGVGHFPAHVVGKLQSIYVFNSDYFVQPFLAICRDAQQYRPCKHEVESLLHFPASLLLAPDNVKVYEFERGKARWTSPVVEFEGHRVWGATAIILAELSVLLSEKRSINSIFEKIASVDSKSGYYYL